MLWGSEATGRQDEHITHLSRQATLRHFSGIEGAGGAGAWAPVVSTEAVFEAAGVGSLSRRMESMKAVGDKGVSMEDGRPGLASSTRGLRGGLGGSSLTRTRVLLDSGLDMLDIGRHVSFTHFQLCPGPIKAGPPGGQEAPPLIYAPAWGCQRAGRSQFSDIGDYGSRAGDSIRGVKARAAVGWRWSLQLETKATCKTYLW